MDWFKVRCWEQIPSAPELKLPPCGVATSGCCQSSALCDNAIIVDRVCELHRYPAQQLVAKAPKRGLKRLPCQRSTRTILVISNQNTLRLRSNRTQPLLVPRQNTWSRLVATLPKGMHPTHRKPLAPPRTILPPFPQRTQTVHHHPMEGKGGCLLHRFSGIRDLRPRGSVHPHPTCRTINSRRCV